MASSAEHWKEKAIGIPARQKCKDATGTVEAVTNVIRHSNATQCVIRLAVDADAMVVEVNDNGIGSDPWTAGVGLEWAFATNWSAFAEYDHYGFDTKTIQMVVTNATFPVVPANLNVRHDIDTLKVGINYRFWSAGPVVARY